LFVGLGEVEVFGVNDEAGGALGAAYPDTAPAGVWGLRRGGVVQGLGAGASGGSAGVRPSGTPHLAHVAVVLWRVSPDDLQLAQPGPRGRLATNRGSRMRARG